MPQERLALSPQARCLSCSIVHGRWCGACCNWNWARRHECNKCRRPKGGQSVAASRVADLPRNPRNDFGYIPPSGAHVMGEGSVVPVTNKTVDGVRRPASTAAPGAKRMGEVR